MYIVKKYSGVHASPHKVCNENKERKKVRRKTTAATIFFDERRNYDCHRRPADPILNIDELWITDSTLNEGTRARVTSELGGKGWFIGYGYTNKQQKLVPRNGGTNILHHLYI